MVGVLPDLEDWDSVPYDMYLLNCYSLDLSKSVKRITRVTPTIYTAEMPLLYSGYRDSLPNAFLGGGRRVHPRQGDLKGPLPSSTSSPALTMTTGGSPGGFAF